jgi:hypothetical protein
VDRLPRWDGRRAALGGLLLLAGAALTGCAAGSAAATPAGTSSAAAPSAAGDAGPVAAPGARPAPCSLVDAGDVSLYVALADWATSSTDQDGRSVCRFSTDGFTVTTVTMALAAPASPPAGLCRPPGATADARPDGDLLCGYSGPGEGSATAVVAGSGLAVGVRVVGPDAQRYATVLARHARSHL